MRARYVVSFLSSTNKVLSLSLQCCDQHVILDRVITALDCICIIRHVSIGDGQQIPWSIYELLYRYAAPAAVFWARYQIGMPIKATRIFCYCTRNMPFFSNFVTPARNATMVSNMNSSSSPAHCNYVYQVHGGSFTGVNIFLYVYITVSKTGI